MGHYDEAYAADFEKNRVREKKRLKEYHKKLDEFRKATPLSTLIPQRFLDSLEDLDNWLYVRISGYGADHEQP